jgi:hypothetical protein
MQQTESKQHLEGLMHQLFEDHANSLERLGYSAKEIFWLNLACLPFLPWDNSTGQEVRLSDLLDSFLHLYQTQAEDDPGENRLGLSRLLKQRYFRVAQVVRCPVAPCLSGGVGPGDARVPDKWSTAAVLIQQIARQWQSSPALPFRLVEDT